MPDEILLAIILVVIVGFPMWLMVKAISWAGRRRGWGLRQYVMGMVLFSPLWFAVIMRYVMRVDPELILTFTLITFLLAVIYGLGLLGWDEFFRARRKQRK